MKRVLEAVLPTTTIKIYEVDPSYVSTGGNTSILNIYTLTINDNDNSLDMDEADDPGPSQVLTTDAGTVTDYTFLMNETSTINGQTVTLKTFEMTIDGITRTFVMSDDTARLSGVEVGDTLTQGSTSAYSSVRYRDIACFVSGTKIDTPDGLKPVEALGTGDLVLTRDHKAQPIRWAGQTHVAAEVLSERNNLRPVHFDAGALGPNTPSEPLLLSPQHRVLLEGWSVELTTGHTEVLVPAKFLKGQSGIRSGRWKDGVTYVHIMFDRHEVIMANGAPCESFLFGDAIRSEMPIAQMIELRTLFPELEKSSQFSARPVLKRRETRTVLMA